MRHLLIAIAFMISAPFVALAQEQQLPPQQQEPHPGEELQGHWTTSVRRLVPRGEIALEIRFTPQAMEFHAVCSFDHGYRTMTAISRSNVDYRNGHFRVINRSYSRLQDGPFFCESGIQPGFVDFERERDGVFRLYFPGETQPIYIFKHN